MERIKYREAKTNWQTIKRKNKNGTTEQLRVTLRYYVDGKRKGKTKLFSAEESSKMDTDRKRDNALRKWITSLEEEQEAAIKREEQALLEAARAEEEARLAAARAEEEANHVLLCDFIRDYVDAREAAGIIEASTATDYRHTCKRLESTFADTTLQGLTSKAVQDYETAELKRGMSPTTVGKSHRLLKQVITYAVRHEVIDKNVMLVVEPPKRPKKKPNGLNLAEAQRVTGILLDQRPTPVSTGAMLALHAGLRAGEVCGLTWSNVDIDNKIIHVIQAVGLADGKGAYLKPTKNDSSIRDVNITDDLAEKLSKRRDLMREELRSADILLTDEQFSKLFVCGGIAGGHPSPQVISREWSTLAEEHNVIGTTGKQLPFHGLRHAFASIGVASNVDIAVLASQMGHSTVSQTLNTYTSATAEGKRLGAKKMGEALHPTKEAEVKQLDRTGTE